MVLIKYEGCSVPSGNQPLPPPQSQGSSTGSQSVRHTEKKKERKKEKVAHLIEDWNMDSLPISPESFYSPEMIKFTPKVQIRSPKVQPYPGRVQRVG